MMLGGAAADVQGVADLGIGGALGEQPQDLELTGLEGQVGGAGIGVLALGPGAGPGAAETAGLSRLGPGRSRRTGPGCGPGPVQAHVSAAARTRAPRDSCCPGKPERVARAVQALVVGADVGGQVGERADPGQDAQGVVRMQADRLSQGPGPSRVAGCFLCVVACRLQQPIRTAILPRSWTSPARRSRLVCPRGRRTPAGQPRRPARPATACECRPRCRTSCRQSQPAPRRPSAAGRRAVHRPGFPGHSRTPLAGEPGHRRAATGRRPGRGRPQLREGRSRSGPLAGPWRQPVRRQPGFG